MRAAESGKGEQRAEKESVKGGGPGPRHTLSLPALKKGCRGTFRVIEDIDFVLQREPLFKMSIESLLGSPVKYKSVQTSPYSGKHISSSGKEFEKSCSTERKATQKGEEAEKQAERMMALTVLASRQLGTKC